MKEEDEEVAARTRNQQDKGWDELLRAATIFSYHKLLPYYKKHPADKTHGYGFFTSRFFTRLHDLTPLTAFEHQGGEYHLSLTI